MGLFSKIFGTDKPNNVGTAVQLLNGYSPSFSSFNGDLYENPQIRSVIDAIARNAAKLNPKHIRSNGSKFEQVNGNIERLISQQPNELMNAYDFYYKVISELYLSNNAFIYISRDSNGNVLGLYPLKAGSYTLMEYKNEIYVKFYFSNGQNYTAPLKTDVIHLKRFFCQDDIRGGSTMPIIETMSIKHIINEGLINAIKTTQGIKGIIKSQKAMLDPKDTKKIRDQFVNDFISNSDGSGLAAMDATLSFDPINLNPQTANDSQIKLVNDEILNYYGISEKILQSNYTEDEWNSFYESTIEPLAVEMSMEFSNKLFSAMEKYHGNKIVFEANRLQYSSAKTKIEIARYMNNYMTMNEIREIFNLPPVDDGDKILQDLNHIDSNVANDYQLGGKK